jgi:hypothetical protein
MGDTPIGEAQRGALAMYFISPLDPATGFAMDWDQTRHRHAEMDTRVIAAVEQARACNSSVHRVSGRCAQPLQPASSGRVQDLRQ